MGGGRRGPAALTRDARAPVLQAGSHPPEPWFPLPECLAGSSLRLFWLL